jgi:hypothetical protein
VKHLHRVEIAVVGIFLAFVFYASLGHVAGCTSQQLEQAQNAADVVHYVTAAATQPTTRPALAAARAGVQIVREFVPVAGELITALALLSAVAGGIIGNARGRTRERQHSDNVINELAEDVADYRQPDEPWSEPTRQRLEELAHYDVAHVPSVDGIDAGDE